MFRQIMKCLLIIYALLFQIELSHVNCLLRSSPTILTDKLANGSVCPTKSLIQQEVETNLRLLDDYHYNRPCQCGGLGWNRVAFLNYSDSAQACPKTSYRHYWEPSNIAGCAGVKVSLMLPVYRTKYSTVCGRILGIGYGLGFTFNLPNDMKSATLDDIYLSGVSLTHRKPGNRKHIWSFVASWSEMFTNTAGICPCINPQLEWPHMIPEYVGEDYFCDGSSGDVGVYDILWDGVTCGPTNKCCLFNHPPFFCKVLGYETSEDIEMRLFYSHIGVSFAEIYVK